jgi:hypothetical protein
MLSSDRLATSAMWAVRGHLVATSVAVLTLVAACSSSTARPASRPSVPQRERRASAPSSVARGRWATTPGTAQRRCVKVGHHTDVRSDTFIVGNFAAYVADWDGTVDHSKLYYIPLYPHGKPRLAVAAKSLGSRGPPVSILKTYGETLSDPFAYTTGTVLPRRGSWRLIATAGRNWGCFDLQF